jgi:hypothetical protein
MSSSPSRWPPSATAAGLSERITDGYAAKFDRHDDPGGHASLGFRRSPSPPHTLEIDSATIGQAVDLFERYALGNVSSKQLAIETGLEASRIRCLLMNPLYNGWVRRHRGPTETRRSSPWRANPPVSDELWARVEEVRRAKTQGGGPRRRQLVDLLAGLLVCVCGRRVRSDGTFADGRHRKLHPDPCQDWGTRARLGDETWEAPLLAQVAALRLDDATIAIVVAALGSADRPVAIDRARIERQMRDLALQHVAAGVSDDAYLARLGALRAQRDTLDRGSTPAIPADRAISWLRALSETWTLADVLAAKADLLHAIYERVTVAGPSIVAARLTPSAYGHGLALALPQVVMARPTGFERADAISIRIPIEVGKIAVIA